MPIDTLEDKDILVSRLQAATHIASAYRHVTGSTRSAVAECWRELDMLLEPINTAIQRERESRVSLQIED